MPRPFASPVLLSLEQRDTLIALVRARSTPQAMALRCRIVLSTAQPEQPTNQQVADVLDCDRHTVGQWRERYVAHGLTGLQDAPRSGRPRSFSPLRTTPRHRTCQ
jgi:Winged helix-turn helix